MSKLKILITNDDGIHAPGLVALREVLKEKYDCIVSAPSSESSATSHAVTLHDKLLVEEYHDEYGPFYSVVGRPADCVKLAVREFMSDLPDLVVSGINRGPNLGVSVYYSGTVGGAREGAICGIPSLALSVASHSVDNYELACSVSDQLIEFVSKNLEAFHFHLLNVNIPWVEPDKYQGVRWTKQARSMFREKFDQTVLEEKKYEYQLGGDMFVVDEDENDDTKAVKEGFTSVTPIQLDTTDYNFLDKYKDAKI